MRMSFLYLSRTMLTKRMADSESDPSRSSTEPAAPASPLILLIMPVFQKHAPNIKKQATKKEEKMELAIISFHIASREARLTEQLGLGGDRRCQALGQRIEWLGVAARQVWPANLK